MLGVLQVQQEKSVVKMNVPKKYIKQLEITSILVASYIGLALIIEMSLKITLLNDLLDMDWFKIVLVIVLWITSIFITERNNEQ